MIQQQRNLNTAIFIRKLFKIVNTKQYESIITWDKQGKSIKILSFEALEKQILDLEFRHKNYKSFIRQLNMYGFKKLKKSTLTITFFFHPLFSKGSEANLHLIQRNQDQKSFTQQFKQGSHCFEDFLSQKRNNIYFIKDQQKTYFNQYQIYRSPGLNKMSTFIHKPMIQEISSISKPNQFNRKPSIMLAEPQNKRNSLTFDIGSKPNTSLSTYPSLKISQQFIPIKLQDSLNIPTPQNVLNQSEVDVVNTITPIPQSYYSLSNQLPFYQPNNFYPQIFVNPVSSPQFVSQPTIYPVYQPSCYPQYYSFFK